MIRKASKSDSLILANMHLDILYASFLASLGLRFLNRLYRYLITFEDVWVYEEENKVLGFVTFSSNSSTMMKQFIFKSPTGALLLLINAVKSPSNIKRYLETCIALLNPNKSINSVKKLILPPAELLSIVVSPNCQASGIGTKLIKVLEENLSSRKITTYKVIAGIDLVGANKLYIKNGFLLVDHINIHSDKLSNVYIKTI
jgi:N-acetylglutamate synthase-like GNAT family acetyltransferase